MQPIDMSHLRNPKRLCESVNAEMEVIRRRLGSSMVVLPENGIEASAAEQLSQPIDLSFLSDPDCLSAKVSKDMDILKARLSSSLQQ